MTLKASATAQLGSQGPTVKRWDDTVQIIVDNFKDVSRGNS